MVPKDAWGQGWLAGSAQCLESEEKGRPWAGCPVLASVSPAQQQEGGS